MNINDVRPGDRVYNNGMLKTVSAVEPGTISVFLYFTDGTKKGYLRNATVMVENVAAPLVIEGRVK